MKPATIESVMAVYEAEKATLRARVAEVERERDAARCGLDAAVASLEEAGQRVAVLEALVREADDALLWASQRSPEAAATMVREARAWQSRARAALAAAPKEEA